MDCPYCPPVDECDTCYGTGIYRPKCDCCGLPAEIKEDSVWMCNKCNKPPTCPGCGTTDPDQHARSCEGWRS
jgi:hypothetical protein